MRRRRNSLPACIEKLERRDCPAVIGVEGSLALEENGGPVTLTVRLSEAQRTPVEVRFLSFGSAKAGADYRISSGGRPLSSSGTLTFRPGQTAIPITVSPINDVAREGTESMTFQLVSARGHILADRLATLTFQDDDNYTATLLGPTQITSGQSATYTIQLSSPATKNEVFYVSTRDGSATIKDNDYWPITDLPVTVTAGQSATSFTLPGSKPNTEPEFDEFYRLTVRTRSANFPTISDVGVVIPGIGPEPAPTISIGIASGNEGNTGTQTLQFDVTLSKAYSQMVTVDYATADGTATVADTDYTAVSGTLTFLPGETRKTIAVGVIGDTKPEQTETFTIVLSAPTNATVANGTGVGSIINDDGQEGFQIELFFTDPKLPEDTRQIFRQAAARWSQIITGDLPAATYGGKVIDDFLLNVTVKNLDPRLLGQANFYPDSLRPGARGLPFRGFAEFNSLYMKAPGIYYTVLHEMGHALGFSPDLWTSPGFNLVSGWGASGASDPRFLGLNATREFNSYFATTGTSVPLEDFQDPGSYGAHWRESVFGKNNELMTYAWNVQSTAVNPISRVTIGAMEDIGYTVNYIAADNYVRPGAALATRAAVARPPRTTTTSLSQSPLSLAFALYQQLAEAKPSDGNGVRGTLQRR